MLSTEGTLEAAFAVMGALYLKALGFEILSHQAAELYVVVDN